MFAYFLNTQSYIAEKISLVLRFEQIYSVRINRANSVKTNPIHYKSKAHSLTPAGERDLFETYHFTLVHLEILFKEKLLIMITRIWVII